MLLAKFMRPIATITSAPMPTNANKIALNRHSHVKNRLLSPIEAPFTRTDRCDLADDPENGYNITMHQTLKCHPDLRCDAVKSIEVEIRRMGSGMLVLRYVVTGAIGDLAIPPVAMPARTDELWRQTCFEAFLRTGPGGAYSEFNFAPSTQWAIYRFSSYRDGMTAAAGAPHIEVKSDAAGFELRATFTPDGPPSDAPWQLGLSAVIEEKSGRKSYWALAHPPGRPDFHHSDCFAIAVEEP